MSFMSLKRMQGLLTDIHSTAAMAWSAVMVLHWGLHYNVNDAYSW